MLGATAGLGTSVVGAQSAEPMIRALIEWANQAPGEAPTDANRNRVLVTTEQLAQGATKALGMDVNGNFPAKALVFNRYAEQSGFVFQRAFHVGQYQGETTIIFSFRTSSELNLYRVLPDGQLRGAWHAELSDLHDVTSQRNPDQAEAASGLQTELDFWRQQLRERRVTPARQ
ncbi:MAG: hypothetical protein WA747_15680 [Steroidobacteraceae bacterium]